MPLRAKGTCGSVARAGTLCGWAGRGQQVHGGRIGAIPRPRATADCNEFATQCLNALQECTKKPSRKTNIWGQNEYSLMVMG